MKTVSGIAMLLLLGMMVTFVGCGEGSTLVGKWEKVDDDEMTLEFFKDGTVIYGGDSKREWKIGKDELIIYDSFRTRTYNYKISGSTLTLTGDRDDGIYQKVK
jgi:hypothetical protein